jgi:hypothetical protein
MQRSREENSALILEASLPSNRCWTRSVVAASRFLKGPRLMCCFGTKLKGMPRDSQATIEKGGFGAQLIAMGDDPFDPGTSTASGVEGRAEPVELAAYRLLCSKSRRCHS